MSWSGGRARVQELGAMLSDVVFRLPDGREVSPLHKAPWLGEVLSPDTPPLLVGLQGEWPCVPFGVAPDAGLKGGWTGLPVAPEPWPHGYGANKPWMLSQRSANRIEATIDYPDDSPIASLSRSVTGQNDRAVIDLTLAITARENVSVPIGLHPVFKLPEEPGAARLLINDQSSIWTYPGDTGGDSAFAYSHPVASFSELTMIGCEGWDPLALPYPCASESVLLLSGCGGSVSLENLAESYRATLTWDASVLPSLMLWISNKGRASAPWSSRHLALGIEPVCSAFDFGSQIAGYENPLNSAGVPTAVSLSTRQPWRTSYRLMVESL